MILLCVRAYTRADEHGLLLVLSRPPCCFRSLSLCVSPAPALARVRYRALTLRHALFESILNILFSSCFGSFALALSSLLSPLSSLSLALALSLTLLHTHTLCVCVCVLHTHRGHREDRVRWDWAIII